MTSQFDLNDEQRQIREPARAVAAFAQAAAEILAL